MLVTSIAVYLVAFKLPLLADFSYLLPQDAPAVVDLRRLEARVKTTDTVLVIIRGEPAARERVQAKMLAGLRAMDPALVTWVEDDDPEVRAFARDHKFILVDADTLTEIRDALDKHIKERKARANPLFVDLGDKEDTSKLDELKDRRKALLDGLDRPRNVSKDGRVAMIQIHTGFAGTDAGLGEKLLAAMAKVRAAAREPGVEIGFTGGVVTTTAEHDAIFDGMVMSSVITTLLVALVLALYFRSATLIVILIGSLGGATLCGFGLTALTVGHLNAATAFLGAVIAGNGINYGILLVARFLEERREHEVDEAMARAIAGTVVPTLIASLAASIAYGSLAATSFKGFADFAIIGAIGMTMCWLASYILLPTLILMFGRRMRRFQGELWLGSVLVKLFGFRNAAAVLIGMLVVAIGAGAIATQYLRRDPFEYDIKHLRSEGEDAVIDRDWMALSDKTFGRGYAGRTVIAAERLDQLPLIVDALKDKGTGTIGTIDSLLLVVPADQPKRLKLLGEIRDLLSDDVLDELEDKDKQEMLDLRPPEKIATVSIADLPATLREKFVEKDGRVGYLISVRPANSLSEWNGKDLVKFADAVRSLKLADKETITTSGSSVIFSDILDTIERDAPLVTLLASLGLVIMVVLIAGRNRRAVAVLVATAVGAVVMVATCALLGLRVTFLNFVALPITLGIGIDYAVNVAHRDDDQPLRTSGAAVFICSLTTIIGYASLLIDDNLAIRGFGKASLIGEIACLLAALIIVPAILRYRRLPSGDHR